MVYVFVSILRNGVRIRTVNEHFKRLVNSESKPILQGLNKKGMKKCNIMMLGLEQRLRLLHSAKTVDFYNFGWQLPP